MKIEYKENVLETRLGNKAIVVDESGKNRITLTYTYFVNNKQVLLEATDFSYTNSDEPEENPSQPVDMITDIENVAMDHLKEYIDKM